MIHRDKLPTDLLEIIDRDTETDFNQFELPPQAFVAMEGKIVSFDLSAPSFRCKFPVLEKHLNPYHVMQGGVISAAIDNTIGPLSMLIAPPNMTRKMEVKYLKAIERDINFIYITATYREKKKRFLYFEATVTNETETIKYATAKATHWVL